MRAFEEKGLQPDVVLTATDADVIKSYVASGVGVAIVQQSVYDRRKDADLRAVDVSHLFGPGNSVLMMCRQVYVRAIVRDFVASIAPEIDLTDLLASSKDARVDRSR